MTEEFWRSAVPELYQLRKENIALRAEVELAQSESRKARKRVAELSAEIDRLAAHLKEAFGDWASDDTAIRDAAKRVLSESDVAGDAWYVPHMTDVCDMLVAEVERLREERRWRTFPANPPDANGRYVCMWADGDIDIQRWETGKWLGAFDHEITHWQPLPAPPQEEE